MAIRIASVTIDCRNARTLAHFWMSALGYVAGNEMTEQVSIAQDPRDRDLELVFIQVPEDKTVKNRVHLDIGADDAAAEVQRLLDLGARKVKTFQSWTVMRDPEDNESCVFASGPPHRS